MWQTRCFSPPYVGAYSRNEILGLARPALNPSGAFGHFCTRGLSYSSRAR